MWPREHGRGLLAPLHCPCWKTLPMLPVLHTLHTIVRQAMCTVRRRGQAHQTTRNYPSRTEFGTGPCRTSAPSGATPIKPIDGELCKATNPQHTSQPTSTSIFSFSGSSQPPWSSLQEQEKKTFNHAPEEFTTNSHHHFLDMLAVAAPLKLWGSACHAVLAWPPFCLLTSSLHRSSNRHFLGAVYRQPRTESGVQTPTRNHATSVRSSIV